MKSEKRIKISQEQILPINGIQLWTVVEGEGKPMVLCHGGPGAYEYLAPVSDMTSDLCRVVRYDQRGSGRSQAVGPYDVSTFVDDLEGLREHFNFERWIVGGHSWGACLALAYAVRFPVRTIAVLHIAGTGIDPQWQEEYRENRLNALSDRPHTKVWHFRNSYAKALLAFRTLLVGSTQQPIIEKFSTIGLTVANPKEATPSCNILIAAF